MRTGGDDIAQALALMGVKPTWDALNRRVTGFEVIPATALGRPRVDVTLRVSGFFRDAFPAADGAGRCRRPRGDGAGRARRPEPRRRPRPGRRARGAVPRVRLEAGGLWRRAAGDDRREAVGRPRRAGRGLSDTGAAMPMASERRGRAGTRRLRRSGWARSRRWCRTRTTASTTCSTRDDYYQFEGGAAAAVATLQGRERPVWHNDHSRPETPAHPHARRRDRPRGPLARGQPEMDRRASSATATRAPSRSPRRSTTSSPSPPPRGR